MQKILSVVWFKILPAQFGGQKGIAEFNQHLSNYYWVDCLCSSKNKTDQKTVFQVLPHLPDGKWQFINPLVVKKIVRFFKKENYSYVIIEFPYYGFIGAILKKKGARFLLHAHNIETQRFRDLKKWWWRIFELYEKWSMLHADMVLFKTEKDKEYAIKKYGLKERKGHVLPYGVNKKIANKQNSRNFLEEQYSIKPDEKILLFAATLDYTPNADACEAIYKWIAPQLCKTLPFSFKIIICGRNSFKKFAYLKQYQHSNVIQAGPVESIEPYFCGSDLFINPVKKVYGVQTKIFDAVSFNLNVVAFKKSETGLPSYILNKKVFLAGSQESFIAQIENALHQNQVTPSEFYDDFLWENIVYRLASSLKTFEKT